MEKIYSPKKGIHLLRTTTVIEKYFLLNGSVGLRASEVMCVSPYVTAPHGVGAQYA